MNKNDIHENDNDFHDRCNDIQESDDDFHDRCNDIHESDDDFHDRCNDIHENDNDFHKSEYASEKEDLHFQDYLHNKYALISCYVIATVLIILILWYVVLHFSNIAGAIGRGAGWLFSVLTPIIWGFACAYLLFPVNHFFEKLLKKMKPFKKKAHMCRVTSVALTALVVVAALVILFSVTISSFTKQVSLVSVDGLISLITSLDISLNSFYHDFSMWLDTLNISSAELVKYVDTIQELLQQFVSSAGDGIMGFLSNLPSFFTTLLFMIIFSIYFQLDIEGLRNYWSRVSKALFSERFNHAARVFIKDADKVFSGYIRGQLLDAILMTVEISIGLSLAGVKFAPIIGILTGIGNLIPYVGPFLAYGSTLIICMINGDMSELVIGIIVIFILQTIDGNIVNPKLLSNSIEIHPMLVIFALIAGSSISGLLGMILAVPVAALIKIQFDRIVNHMIRIKSKRSR